MRARIGVLLGLLCITALAGAATPQNPLQTERALYLSRQGVHKFDLTSLKPLWSSLEGVETYAPVAAGNLILVGSTQGLYALDRGSGQVSWRIEAGRNLVSPTIEDRSSAGRTSASQASAGHASAGRAYTGSVHGELYAIDTERGSIDWRRRFDGWIYAPAVDAGTGTLWSAGQAHRIYALDADDGRIVAEFDTTQEAVFSPVDLGDRRIGFNLFDGSTAVVDARRREIAAILPGTTQPMDLSSRDEGVFRSHRDGSLTAFDRHSLAPAWQKSMVERELTLHPSLPGYLLMSDLDRGLVLLDLSRPEAPCRLMIDGRWQAPIQLEAKNIVVFRKLMQPLQNIAVEMDALCQ